MANKNLSGKVSAANKQQEVLFYIPYPPELDYMTIEGWLDRTLLQSITTTPVKTFIEQEQLVKAYFQGTHYTAQERRILLSRVKDYLTEHAIPYYTYRGPVDYLVIIPN